MNNYNNLKEEESNYLDDLSSSSAELNSIGDYKYKFCNSCGYQCFPISFAKPDLFKCSQCGRTFSEIEKSNLKEKEKIKPISQNKSSLPSHGNVALSIDAYDAIEEDKQIQNFREELSSIVTNNIPQISTTTTTTKKRFLDNDDKILLDRGFTLIDIE